MKTDSFLPDKFESAKSFKFEHNYIQISKGYSKFGLAARRFLNYISGGKIGVNPKLDHAITKVTGFIMKDDHLQFENDEHSQIFRELKKLNQLAKYYGSDQSVKDRIIQAQEHVNQQLKEQQQRTQSAVSQIMDTNNPIPKEKA